MMSRILGLVVLLPLAVLLVVFCVLNRAPVILSMDVFGTTPQFTLQSPLFVVVLAALILGVVLGGIGTFIGQARYRSKAARREEEIERLRREVAASNERLRVVREERGHPVPTPAPGGAPLHQAPGAAAPGTLPGPSARPALAAPPAAHRAA